jgi:hypothetical protein
VHSQAIITMRAVVGRFGMSAATAAAMHNIQLIASSRTKSWNPSNSGTLAAAKPAAMIPAVTPCT